MRDSGPRILCTYPATMAEKNGSHRGEAIFNKLMIKCFAGAIRFMQMPNVWLRGGL